MLLLPAAPAAAASTTRRCRQMDVAYEGEVVLSEAQLTQLLGYQAVLDKHVNWGRTRMQVRAGCCGCWWSC